ncbi:MAG: phosphoenolpyruvate carboxylase [Rhodothermales bacterium]|nr:phosphoenolpyruvate carboxylase [Rhodothermales bacterium]
MQSKRPWPDTATPAGASAPLAHVIERLTDHLGDALSPELAARLTRLHRTDSHEELTGWLKDLTDEDLERMLRTETALFHLLNQAEKTEITRVNRERALAAGEGSGRPESLMDAVRRMKESGMDVETFHSLAQRLDIRPTITAHPTEARRRSILYRQQAVGQALRSLNRRQLTAYERADAEQGLARDIHLLHLTDEVRPRRLTVGDEVEYGLYFLKETIWDTLPSIYEDLRRASRWHFDTDLRDIAPIQFRSWIGSDRDGNPFVTPETTINTFLRQRQTAIRLFTDELRQVRRVLSVSENQAEIPALLTESLKKDASEVTLPPIVLQQFEREPYRLKLSYVMARLHVLSQDPLATGAYRSSDFRDDIAVVQRGLAEAGLEDAAYSGPLQHLADRAQAFGLHLAALDVRQHSRVHEEAVSALLKRAGVVEDYAELPENRRQEVLSAELANPRPLLPPNAELDDTPEMVLETFRAIERILSVDPEGFGTFVVSMTHTVSDILEVMLLAKEVGLAHSTEGGFSCPLDIAPLFETVDDLAHCGGFMETLFAHPSYRDHLSRRGDFQEMMLGYSDSNKDGGFWMANWALHGAQKTLGDVCRTAGIDFRLFHGRGGTVGRGGGRANRAISAMPESCRNGRIRFTEQGEVISFRYGQPDIAHRHLEQIAGATLSTSTESVSEAPYPEAWKSVMEVVSRTAMDTYRGLIDHPDFWAWYTATTPIEHISRLPIASRPVSRKAAGQVDFDGLRAIPWVFAWTQTRYTIPGWYGTGAGLQAGLAEHEAVLQDMYREWPFFNALMDAVQLEMARARLEIAASYAAQSKDGRFHEWIAADYAKAEDAVLRITGNDALLAHSPAVRTSISYRNPLTDPLNAMQLELLGRYRNESDDARRERLRGLLFLSINGIAAAMQSTG